MPARVSTAAAARPSPFFGIRPLSGEADGARAGTALRPSGRESDSAAVPPRPASQSSPGSRNRPRRTGPECEIAVVGERR
jgi:hypothetical protein